MVVRRRAARDFEQVGRRLCEVLDGVALEGFPRHSVSVRYATEHRCGVVVHGPGLSGAVSGTDPLKDGRRLMRCEPMDDSAEAAFSARVTQAASDAFRRALAAHPLTAERRALGLPVADVVLLRGCGVRLDTQPFSERHGMRAAMVAPTKVIAGMGIQLGFDLLEAKGATGDYHTDLGAKAARLAKALGGDGAVGGEGYDLCFAHIKAVDDAGHDQDIELKVRAIEAVDAMLLRLLGLLREAERRGEARYVVVVTADHSTPVVFGDHSHEPVPFAVARVADAVGALGEEAAAAAARETAPITPGAPAGAYAGCTCGDNECHNRWTCRRRVVAGASLPNVEGAAAVVTVRPPRRPHAPSGARVGNGVTAAARSPQRRLSDPPSPPLRAITKGIGLARSGGGFSDDVRSFAEVAAAGGALGRFPGAEVMPLLQRFVAALHSTGEVEARGRREAA